MNMVCSLDRGGGEVGLGLTKDVGLMYTANVM
jgi:hypothetical protein